MTGGGAGRRLALAAVLGASVLLDAWGLGWGLLIFSNLDKVDPEICVFLRASR